MITKHRIRRSRTQPQPGALGAPFLGAYSLDKTIDAANGMASFQALAIDPINGQPVTSQILQPLKVLDRSAFRMFYDGIEDEITSAQVSAGGDVIEVTFPPQITTVVLWALAGHPELLSIQGLQCGGAYAAG